MARIWASTAGDTASLGVGAEAASCSFEQEESANAEAAHSMAVESTFLTFMILLGVGSVKND
jgi:hypothetical protein